MNSLSSMQKCAKYTLQFLLLVFLASAKTIGGLTPFYLGLFVALVYTRENLIIVAPLFVAAMLIADFSWQSAFLAVAAAAVLLAAYYIHYLMKRRMNIWQVLLYSAISQLPIFFIYGTAMATIIIGLISFAISLGFTLSCIKICSAIRRGRRRFTNMEKIAGAAVLLAIGMGAYSVSVGGITPYFLIAAFLALLSVQALGGQAAFLCALYGMGAVLHSGEAGIMLSVMLAVIMVFVLRGQGILMYTAPLVSELISVFYLKIYADYSPYNLIFVLVGCLMFGLLPLSVKSKLQIIGGVGNNCAVKAIVNRSRLDMYGKLDSIAGALLEMQGQLTTNAAMPELSQSKSYLCRQLSDKLCSNCKGRGECCQQLNGDTSIAFYDLVSRAVDKGRATIVDIPPFLSSNCVKVNALLKELEELSANYNKRKQEFDFVDRSRAMMGEQAAGLAGILDTLAAEMKRAVTFDGKRERRIIDELAYNGIIAGEAVVFSGEDEMLNVTVTLRDCDAENKRIERIVGKVLKTSMIKQSMGVQGGGYVTVNLINSPKYDAIVGECSCVKDGSDSSGDTKSITRLDSDKIMIAICDGMGSGKAAEEGSSSALALVESFYKSGIQEEITLSLINKLLGVKNEENFQVLDMCVVNLRTGIADFIKLGAPESVVKYKEKIELIEGGALPLGILEEVRPSISRKKLTSGDMVILCSDGITDSIGADGVVRVAEQSGSSNPQTVAELIMEDSECAGRGDDKTVVALRLFRKL